MRFAANHNGLQSARLHGPGIPRNPAEEPAHREYRTLTPHPNPLPVRGEGIVCDSSNVVKSDPAVRSSLSPHRNPLPVRGEGIICDWSNVVKSDPAVRSSLSPHGERVRVRGRRRLASTRKSTQVIYFERLINLIADTLKGGHQAVANEGRTLKGGHRTAARIAASVLRIRSPLFGVHPLGCQSDSSLVQQAQGREMAQSEESGRGQPHSKTWPNIAYTSPLITLPPLVSLPPPRLGVRLSSDAFCTANDTNAMEAAA
jgi:hypothetical protein